MDSRSNPEQSPLLSRLLSRILDRSKHFDYAWVVAFAAWPILYSWLIGAHGDTADISDISDGFAGYWGQANWTLMVLLLPIAVFVLRWVMNRIAPVSAPWPPPSVPAIVGLIETEDGKRQAYEALRRTILSPRNMIAALLVTMVIQVADMHQLAGFYLADPVGICDAVNADRPCAEEVRAGTRSNPDGNAGEEIVHLLSVDSFTVEKDWSVVFLDPNANVGKWHNLGLNVSAYSLQFSLILIGLLLVILILRHNLFFLFRIYQRRRVPAGEEQAYIHVDLDDDDQCFGFRRANDAFNTQVLALFIAAVFILFTRFNNVNIGSGLFRDAGQWLAVTSWLAALAMVTLPIAVKLLPRLPAPGSERPPASIIGYLREFLSDDAWASGNDPPPEEVAAVAARFAENAFWPTGNNRARQLFFLAFCVFFIALVPDPRAIESLQSLPSWSRYVGWVASAGIAWGATWLVFAFLRGMLSYIDERLVDPPEHPISENAAHRRRQIPIGLFVSYRRADTAAYAGRLRDSLSAHIDRERIFMDIDTISGGVDFPEAIETAIGSAQAMLVVIGDQWLELAGEDGHPRIQDPQDFVRMEVALGLESGIRVFPVLVGGAKVPSETDLPENLKDLVRRNACEISNTRWDYDVGKMLEDLEKLRIPKKRGSEQESLGPRARG